MSDLIREKHSEQLWQNSDLVRLVVSFREVAGLPLRLTSPLGTVHLPNGFAELAPACSERESSMAKCHICAQFQQKLCAAAIAIDGPVTEACPFGLTETVVALRVGGVNYGFLQTGFVRVEGTPPGAELEDSPPAAAGVVTANRYGAAMDLLARAVPQIAQRAREIVEEGGPPPMPAHVTLACAWVQEHAHEEVRMTEAARVAGVSPLHFCKIFRQHTGLRFTEYVQRVRVRRARGFLVEEKRKIAEIAMACGCGSVSQFNRVFRRHTRQTPRAFQAAQLSAGKK